MKFSATPNARSFLQFRQNLGRMVDRIGMEGTAKASKKAAAPMLAAAKAKVKVRSGLLQKSLTIKQVKLRKGKSVITYVGPNKATEGVDSRGRKTKAVKYAHVIEFGRRDKRKGAAQPFMRPAFEETKEEAIRIYAAEIDGEIQKAAKKEGARNPI